jgi:hypothetical protein
MQTDEKSPTSDAASIAMVVHLHQTCAALVRLHDRAAPGACAAGRFGPAIAKTASSPPTQRRRRMGSGSFLELVDNTPRDNIRANGRSLYVVILQCVKSCTRDEVRRGSRNRVGG